jgi:mannose-1-phosphate guanylyltransferase
MVDELQRVMGDGARFGVRLRYAVEREPLGTAGGVRNAADLVAGRLVVLNGDVLTDLDLGAMLRRHAERGAAATIALTPVPDPTAYGLVELGPHGRVRRFVEKPPPDQVTTDTINAGVYVLERGLLARIPAGRPVSIEREFFPGLLADGLPCYGWVTEAYWLDIGSPAKYLQGQLDLLAGRVRSPVAAVAPGQPRLGADVALAAGARVVPPAVVGAGCRLAAGARVGPAAVLGPGCTVGADAVVESAVLWEMVEVGAAARVAGCVVGARARLAPGARVPAGAVVAADAAVPAGRE